MKNVYYEVWGLCYDKDGFALESEEFLGEFKHKEDAISHAKKFKDVSYVYNEDIMNYLNPGDYMEIRVETVEQVSGMFENVDTVYSQNIY